MMWRRFGCAVYVGHVVHLAPNRHHMPIAHFRLWGASVWRFGLILGSQWAPEDE